MARPPLGESVRESFAAGEPDIESMFAAAAAAAPGSGAAGGANRKRPSPAVASAIALLRADPKLYLAAERVLIHWLGLAALVLLLSFSLLTGGSLSWSQATSHKCGKGQGACTVHKVRAGRIGRHGPRPCRASGRLPALSLKVAGMTLSVVGLVIILASAARYAWRNRRIRSSRAARVDDLAMVTSLSLLLLISFSGLAIALTAVALS